MVSVMKAESTDSTAGSSLQFRVRSRFCKGICSVWLETLTIFPKLSMRQADPAEKTQQAESLESQPENSSYSLVLFADSNQQERLDFTFIFYSTLFCSLEYYSLLSIVCFLL